MKVVGWEEIDLPDDEEAAGLPPSAREGHAAATCDSRFVAVIGGFAFSDSLKVHLYDPEAASGTQWSEEISPECTSEVFQGEYTCWTR